MVVRLALIIDKALCTVGSDALEHGLVKSACSERGLGTKRLGPAGFASRIFLCFVPAALGIFLIELVYLGLPLSLPLTVFTEIFQVILKGLALHCLVVLVNIGLGVDITDKIFLINPV